MKTKTLLILIVLSGIFFGCATGRKQPRQAWKHKKNSRHNTTPSRNNGRLYYYNQSNRTNYFMFQ